MVCLKLQAVTRPLFVHYILGKYFIGEEEGPAQLQWLLGEVTMTGLNLSGAVAKSIKEFNDEVIIIGRQ